MSSIVFFGSKPKEELPLSYDWLAYDQKLKLLEMDASCIYCRRSLDVYSASLDHFVPKAKGGNDAPGNVVLACKPCNKKKRDLMPLEFVMQRREGVCCEPGN